MGRKHVKYDMATRAKVWGKIRSLYDSGKLSPQIVEALRADGLTLPDGVTPMTQEYVSKTLAYLYGAKRPEPEAVYIEKRVQRLPDTVIGILTDPTLNNDQKIKMICAYAEI